jgi:hypothetical protein
VSVVAPIVAVGGRDVEDFRSDKMESREGAGIARRAWDAYVRAIGRAVTPAAMPLTGPVIRRFSVNKAVDLVGFWVMWHLHGGFEGLQKLGMAERTTYRQIKWFRLAYKEHPDTA